jgi:hypothetical protein
VSGTDMPLATANEVMTQVPWLELTPKLPAIVGIDTLAIVPSSTCMKVPSARAIEVTASIMPVIGAGPAGVAPAPAEEESWAAMRRSLDQVLKSGLLRDVDVGLHRQA